MDYRVIYRELIRRGKDRPPLKGYVRYQKSLLTPREHVLCILAMSKFGHVSPELKDELRMALWGVVLSPPLQKVATSVFSHVGSQRRESSEPRKKRVVSQRGPRNPFWKKSHTPAFKARLSRMQSGRGNTMFGKKRTEAEKRQISQALKGVPLSAETRRKMSEAGRRQPRYQCHVCGEWHIRPNYVRKHGNNCRKIVYA